MADLTATPIFSVIDGNKLTVYRINGATDADRCLVGPDLARVIRAQAVCPTRESAVVVELKDDERILTFRGAVVPLDRDSLYVLVLGAAA